MAPSLQRNTGSLDQSLPNSVAALPRVIAQGGRACGERTFLPKQTAANCRQRRPCLDVFGVTKPGQPFAGRGRGDRRTAGNWSACHLAWNGTGHTCC